MRLVCRNNHLQGEVIDGLLIIKCRKYTAASGFPVYHIFNPETWEEVGAPDESWCPGGGYSPMSGVGAGLGAGASRGGLTIQHLTVNVKELRELIELTEFFSSRDPGIGPDGFGA